MKLDDVSVQKAVEIQNDLVYLAEKIRRLYSLAWFDLYKEKRELCAEIICIKEYKDGNILFKTKGFLDIQLPLTLFTTKNMQDEVYNYVQSEYRKYEKIRKENNIES